MPAHRLNLDGTPSARIGGAVSQKFKQPEPFLFVPHPVRCADIRMIEISLRSKPLKYPVVVAEFLVTLGLIVYVAKTYVAEVFAETQSVSSLQAAIRFDSGNARYHLLLGRLFLYGAADFDLNRAAEELKRATELNPYDPQAWLDFAFAQESLGNRSEAEVGLRRADLVAPRIVSYQWSIGNMFLIHGNVDEALRHFRVVLAGTSQYDPMIFETAWKAVGKGDVILDRLIPNQARTQFAYLSYLNAHNHLPEAQALWKRIIQSQETFSIQQAAGYLDWLIAAHQSDEALRAWIDLKNRGLIKPIYEPTQQNLILNGDFEEDVLNLGFDWRISRVTGADTRIDQSSYHSPSHAAFIEFLEEQNLKYEGLFQYVRVSPLSSYRLRAFLKTEEITTDSGPRLEVRDAYDSRLLDQYSDSMVGSTPGWVELNLDFATGPNSHLAIISVTRLPSHKLANKIAGRAWVDDFRLIEVPQENTRR